VFSEVTADIRHELDVSGVTDLVGQDGYFESDYDLEDAFRAATADKPT
jgi:hypothetical protein